MAKEIYEGVWFFDRGEMTGWEEQNVDFPSEVHVGRKHEICVMGTLWPTSVWRGRWLGQIWDFLLYLDAEESYLWDGSNGIIDFPWTN